LKHDGWRCVAYVDRGHVELVSRWGNAYKRFLGLEAALADALPRERAIIDGEVVCLDGDGRSMFYNLRG
jgi:ATP-dependent DNA ligase